MNSGDLKAISSDMNCNYHSSQKFHEESKTPYYIKLLPKLKNPPKDWIETYYKDYVECKKLKLPKPSLDLKKTIIQVLTKRKSRRNFTAKKLSLQELSDLLFYSAGIKNNFTKEKRFYPSAGAKYPLEIYIIAQKIKNLKKGLYHYQVKSHSLEILWNDKSFFNEFYDSFSQPWIKESALVILISSVFWRNQVKYGDRGYRYILLEAGHLCENIYLNCEALNLGCCEIGGFIDNKLSWALAIDDKKEAVIVGLGIGRYD